MSLDVDVDRPVRRRVVRALRAGDGDGGARHGTHRPLAQVFAIAASAVAVIAVTAIALGGFALWRLDRSSTALIDGASPALLTAQELSGALVDQETGVRGFGLTGRAEFLEPYTDGFDAQRDAIARLREFDAASAVSDIGSEIDAVEQSVERWRSEYAEPVLAGSPAAPATEEGLVLFDEVRAQSATLVDDLEEQRAAARSGVRNASAFVVGVGIAIAVVLVAMLVAAGVGLRRSVLRPVSDLAAQVRDVVSGDMQRSVRVEGPREIVDLGDDVDAMRRYILRDLDVTQQANQRLDEQARDLERSNRDLEQFAYVASHDLQEPLRKVSSFCQLLQRRYGGQLDERADQYIEFAVDGAQRMQRLINDLLAFSRVGRNTEEFEPVELAAVAAAAATQLETVRDEAGGDIVLGELPVVHGDRRLLQQLFVNLIGNGLKFHRDGVPPVVRVDSRQVGDGWEITVADNGIGIEAEYTDKVFVIFQRLHGRDLYPGTGIGLALSKKIVEFHDGRIGLDHGAGPGATIRFTLPAQGKEST